jgi:hypothetical protein
LGVGQIGRRRFGWDCICWNIIEVLLLQAIPRLSLCRLQHVNACHPYMLTGGVNVELPLAQDNYQKNGCQEWMQRTMVVDEWTYAHR